MITIPQLVYETIDYIFKNVKNNMCKPDNTIIVHKLLLTNKIYGDIMMVLTITLNQTLSLAIRYDLVLTITLAYGRIKNERREMVAEGSYLSDLS